MCVLFIYFIVVNIYNSYNLDHIYRENISSAILHTLQNLIDSLLFALLISTLTSDIYLNKNPYL